MHRFLSRPWTAAAEAPEGGSEFEGESRGQSARRTGPIHKVTKDMQARFAFNTAIAAVMELVNEIYRRREEVPASHVRFAIATAASLTSSRPTWARRPTS